MAYRDVDLPLNKQVETLNFVDATNTAQLEAFLAQSLVDGGSDGCKSGLEYSDDPKID